MHFENWWRSKWEIMVAKSMDAGEDIKPSEESFNLLREAWNDGFNALLAVNTALRESNADMLRHMKVSKADLDSAKTRISEFDYCIRKIATELGGVCCGGVDVDQSNPHSTTVVLVGAIRELRAQAAAKFLK